MCGKASGVGAPIDKPFTASPVDITAQFRLEGWVFGGGLLREMVGLLVCVYTCALTSISPDPDIDLYLCQSCQDSSRSLYTPLSFWSLVGIIYEILRNEMHTNMTTCNETLFDMTWICSLCHNSDFAWAKTRPSQTLLQSKITPFFSMEVCFVVLFFVWGRVGECTFLFSGRLLFICLIIDKGQRVTEKWQYYCAIYYNL